MATTSSIGSASRNYSTIAAWLAAFAAGGWIGECYDDSTFNESSLQFSGHSTSAANFITLTTAAGQSVTDKTNIGLYPSFVGGNGVTIFGGPSYDTIININESYVSLKKLQIYNNASTGSIRGILVNFGVTNTIVDRCLCSLPNGGDSNSTAMWASSGLVVTNSVFDGGITSGVVLYYGSFGADTVFVNNTIFSLPLNSNTANEVQKSSGTGILFNRT